MEGFGDQFFGDVGAVGVGGVDEVDAEVDGAAEGFDGGVVIFGGPQMPGPVMRMAPKPRRWTGALPPNETVPAKLAVILFAVIVASKKLAGYSF